MEKKRLGRGLDTLIGGPAADSWLSRHGNKFGLCQTYANERWHFELSIKPGSACPPMIADASAG